MAAPLRSRPESGREGLQRTTRHALRPSVPPSSIRTVTVGFGFAPNLLPLPNPAGARGLRRSLAITAGGDFHPALRTSAGPLAQPSLLRTQWNGSRNGSDA